MHRLADFCCVGLSFCFTVTYKSQFLLQIQFFALIFVMPLFFFSMKAHIMLGNSASRRKAIENGYVDLHERFMIGEAARMSAHENRLLPKEDHNRVSVRRLGYWASGGKTSEEQPIRRYLRPTKQILQDKLPVLDVAERERRSVQDLMSSTKPAFTFSPERPLLQAKGKGDMNPIFPRKLKIPCRDQVAGFPGVGLASSPYRIPGKQIISVPENISQGCVVNSLKRSGPSKRVINLMSLSDGVYSALSGHAEIAPKDSSKCGIKCNIHQLVHGNLPQNDMWKVRPSLHWMNRDKLEATKRCTDLEPIRKL